MCSLRSNTSLLLLFLKNHNFSIIALTETWISQDDSDIFPYFTVVVIRNFYRHDYQVVVVGLASLLQLLYLYYVYPYPITSPTPTA